MLPTPLADRVPSAADGGATTGMGGRLHRGFTRRLADSGLEQLTIRWRFRLVVMAFGIPFLAYIVWSSTQQALLEKAHVRERARANATLMASRFEDHIDQADRLLATISQSVGTHIDDVSTTSELLQSLRAYVPKPVDNIGVWALDGSSITSLDRRSSTRGVNVADRAYFRNAIARRDLAFEGPFRSRSTGAEIIQFARPIFNAKREVIAVLSMSVQSGELITQLDPDETIRRDALVMVIGRDGRIVARSSDADQWVGKSVLDLEMLERSFADRSGTLEVAGVDGITRLTGFAAVSRWPWLVSVGEPVDKVLGPVSDRLLRNLGLGLAIFGLALLIAGRVAKWTTTPLTMLTADAERLGHGDLAHRSAVTTGGEIATLAGNFNAMAAALEQRDLALATSRTQLRAIADNIPAQITYVDHEQRYRFVNAHPGPFNNIDPESMIGRTVLEVRGDEVHRLLLPSFERAMRGETHSGEHSAMIEGRLSHFHVSYVPDFDAHREVCGVYAFTQDITERKDAELLRIESEKRLVTITDNLPAMICYVDETRAFRFANRAFERWFARPLAEIIGQPFDRMMPPSIAAQYDYYFLRGMQGESLDYELQVPGPERDLWLKCAFIPDIDGVTGKARGVYGMIHNVTREKEAEQRLTRLAQFDSLTGLANRHQFNETFETALRANDGDGKPLALMFLDIDHFKQVNDRLGHGIGDLLLKEFGQRLASCLRPTDAVARLSGDEFVVLLEGMHADDEPQFIARKIIAAVEKPFMLERHFVHVTTSIGIAMREQRGEIASVLMNRADAALYEAKRGGRNTFRLAVS